MKKTYTRTLMIRDLSEALVKLYVSEKPKFESDEEDFKKIMIDGIKSWSIIDGEDVICLVWIFFLLLIIFL